MGTNEKVAATLHPLRPAPTASAAAYAEEILKRGREQAERYEARIAEQARLLGLQGKRITMAIGLIDDVGCEGLQDEERLAMVVKVLKGEVDG